MTGEEAQYHAWGAVYRQTNISSAHIANGVILLLRAADKLDPFSEIDVGDSSFPAAFGDAVRDVLRASDLGLGLSGPERSLCVTKDKKGSLHLDEAPDGTSQLRDQVRAAGRAHIAKVLKSGVLTAEHHDLIAGVLNADRRVMISGGSDPTTPGLILAGYTSTHTLASMHSATFLGLLAASGEGRECLSKLYSILSQASDPHSRLIRLLSIGSDRDWSSSDSDWDKLYPLPQDEDDKWLAKAEQMSAAAMRLIDWSGNVSTELIMRLVDLAGLFFTTDILLWSFRLPGVEPEETKRVLPVFAPEVFRNTHKPLLNLARRAVQVARVRLDDEATTRDLVIKTARSTWTPSAGALNLGAATGWLEPADARGGAMRYFSPGTRQLRTLVHSVVGRGKDLAWADFDRRVRDLFGLTLGGYDEVALSSAVGAQPSEIISLGELNQDRLVQLGLAREESDGVFRVDGGP